MKKIAILIVAYNAASTLSKVLDRIPKEIYKKVEEICVFDDCSKDDTYQVGEKYKLSKRVEKLSIFKNNKNLGYGGNQKLGYDYAISKGYDIVVLLHGDGQYAPEVLFAFLEPLESGYTDAVFGSRMMIKGKALKGGMPLYKYLGNKILTYFQNKMLKMKLSEFHSGYRAYSCHALKQIPYHLCSDDFHFDTDIIIQFQEGGFKIIEIPIPTYYGDEICYVNGIKYAFNVIKSAVEYKLHKIGLKDVKKFDLGKQPYLYKGDKYDSHQRIINLVPDNKKVLDVGCGEGFISKELLKKNCEVIGIDKIKNDNIVNNFSEYIIKDIEIDFDIPYKQYFDYIIFADILEHVRNADKILEESKLILKDDGKIIVSTGNVANIYIRLNLLLGRFNYTGKGILDKNHIKLFTYKTIRSLIELHGFKIIKSMVTPIPIKIFFTENISENFIINIFYDLLNLITNFWKRLFGYQFILIAEKKF